MLALVYLPVCVDLSVCPPCYEAPLFITVGTATCLCLHLGVHLIYAFFGLFGASFSWCWCDCCDRPVIACDSLHIFFVFLVEVSLMVEGASWPFFCTWLWSTINTDESSYVLVHSSCTIILLTSVYEHLYTIL